MKATRSFDMNDFINELPLLGAKRLSYILGVRSETDPVLNKILSVALAFQKPISNFEEIVDVLNVAIDIPELVPDNEGHDQILDEVFWQIKQLANTGNLDLAKRVACYAIEQGQKMVENFEEGFSWNGSLEEIEKWLASNGERK